MYEPWKNCRGRTGRVDGKTKALQEVLADLKRRSNKKTLCQSLIIDLEMNILLSPLQVDSSPMMNLQDRKYLDENGSSHILPIRSIPKLECQYYTYF